MTLGKLKSDADAFAAQMEDITQKLVVVKWLDWDQALPLLHQQRGTAERLVPYVEQIIRRLDGLLDQQERIPPDGPL